MSAIHFVRRFVFSLPKDRIFTTRECLVYGKRSAIDYALHMLVKKEVIWRLARGVFVRNTGLRPEFSPFTIATIKAKAFGKELVSHGLELAAKLKLKTHDTTDYIFAVNGADSSFRYGEHTIRLRHVGPRQIKLGESKAGQVARALWYMGKHSVHGELIQKATANLFRTDREQLQLLAVSMPAWLSASFLYRVRWRFVPIIS